MFQFASQGPFESRRDVYLGAVGMLCYSVILAGSTVCHAQESVRLCPDTTMSGTVEQGERFEQFFGDSLKFVLDPSKSPPNPDGWTIRVVGPDSTHDYLLVATPPYRFSNPRYLDTSYGHSASEAVDWTPRTFRFVVDEASFQKMNEAIGVLLWPADKTSDEIDEATATLGKTNTARGEFRILSAETSDPTSDMPMGRIEKLSFEVELCRGE
jgi:hypothetical protein